MARMKRIVRKGPSGSSNREVMIVKEEDEVLQKPLEAEAVCNAVPTKSRRKKAIPPPPPKRGRYRPRPGALREVKKYQSDTRLLIGKTPFKALCEQIVSEIGRNHVRFDESATDALQEACETFLVQYFTGLNLCALHAKRVTIMLKDSAFLKSLMKVMTPSHALAKAK
ncbi:histone-fold-containing protein [Trichoderma chlorosporum]